MNQQLKLILNTLTLCGTLFVNYWFNSGAFNGKTVGDISDKYENLFTPADYAFIIWGFIYLWLLAFVGYQWYAWLKRKDDTALNQTGIWFMLANIANGTWVIVWLNESIGLSVIIMLFLLLSLIMLVLRLNMERWDAPLFTIAFVWWPICWYIGWIILATVANISAYLTSIGWNGGPFSEEAWTIIMIIVATIVYLFLIFTRNMREASLIGIWGLIAIAVKQWGVHPDIVYTAIGAAVILLIASSYHGYKNRATAPFVKWKNKELYN
jgi:hypothetical protein